MPLVIGLSRRIVLMVGGWCQSGSKRRMRI
jgi:hypothetical protein